MVTDVFNTFTVLFSLLTIGYHPESAGDVQNLVDCVQYMTAVSLRSLPTWARRCFVDS